MASDVREAFLQQDAAAKVIWRSASCSILGLSAGALIGLRRALPPLDLALKTGVNTTAVAFTFFAFREYLTSPVEKRYLTSPSTLHTEGILASSAAGALAGGSLMGFTRGPHRIVSGGFTAALGCSMAQLIVNEISYIRIRILQQKEMPKLNSKAFTKDFWLGNPDRRKRSVPNQTPTPDSSS